MTKFLLRLSLCAAALAAVTSTAQATDYAPPPPPGMHGGNWSGPYIGGFAGGTFVEGAYDNGAEFELSGDGWYGGALAGYNYDFDGLVVGIEADYGWGLDETAQNRDATLDAELEFDGVITARARVGWADDDTLFYVTGGYGWIDATVSGLDAGADDDDSGTHDGWVAGGGIEHMFAGGFSGRLEYLYGEFSSEEYSIGAVDVDVDLEQIHFVRAGLIYNFGDWW